MSNINNRKNLVKVAKLYYSGNMSQDQIAKIMGISRPKVSRMLTMAKKLKIVEFKICELPTLNEELAQKIRDYFKLKDVIVAPSGATVSQSKENVGKAAADYLNGILRNNLTIGVTWGSTLNSMYTHFIPKLKINNATVVQLTGGLHTHLSNMDGRELVKKMANKLNADWYVLQTPFVIQNRNLRSLLMQEPEIKQHFEMFNRIDTAFIGLGSAKPEESVTYLTGYISVEESKQLVEMGCTADLCGHRLSDDGREVENLLTERVISISLDTLKKIPLVVALGAGEEKCRSIIAGAKGGYINTLIIDEIAAISVIGMENIK